MNRRLLTTLSIAFVIAAICGFLVYRMVGTHLTAVRTVQTTRVVAAAKDIPLGTILAPADLTTVEISGGVPQGAVLQAKEAIGRGALSDLYKGEPIVNARLSPVGSGGGLAPTITPGMRACAVKVDQVVGVAGFVTPGMRVDVIVTGNPPGESQSPDASVSHTVLQNIRVLSAGADIQRDAEGKPHQVQVVNLLVTPEQAQTLALATGPQTRIQLVLRNPLDTKVDKIPNTAMTNLFGETTKQPVTSAAAPRRVRPARPQGYSVVIYNGSQRSEQKVNPPGE